jgi:D-xylose transport system substrate-binding protein
MKRATLAVLVLVAASFLAVPLFAGGQSEGATGSKVVAAYVAPEKAPPTDPKTEQYKPVTTYKHRLVPANKAVTIGFLLPSQKIERFTRDAEIFTKYAESKGAKVLWDSADYDHAKQLTQVENMLTKGVDILVIHPVQGDQAGVFVEMAHKQGVPVISSDGVIKHKDIDLFITQDSVTVGKAQAQAYIDMVGKSGKYVIIMGQPGHSVAKLITEGNHAILDKYPGMKLVLQTEHQSWSPEKAQKTAEDVLTRENDDIQAFFCNNSGMANGVLQAVVARNLQGKIFVAGADADRTMCTNILNYNRVIDVIKWIAPLSMEAVDAAIAMAHGDYNAIKYHNIYEFSEPNGSVPTIVTPVTVVTRENIQKTVIDSNWIPDLKK